MAKAKPSPCDTKRRGRIWLIVGIVVLALAVAAVLVVLLMPKPVPLGSPPDIAAVPNGIHTGSYENGIVAATVEVDVQDGVIQNIRILRHQNGLGSSAESIVDEVVAAQSLQVDTVSGATFSSQTILKAIENALTGE